MSLKQMLHEELPALSGNSNFFDWTDKKIGTVPPFTLTNPVPAYYPEQQLTE